MQKVEVTCCRAMTVRQEMRTEIQLVTGLGPDSDLPHNKVDGELIAADEKFHLKRNMKVFSSSPSVVEVASSLEMRV